MVGTIAGIGALSSGDESSGISFDTEEERDRAFEKIEIKVWRRLKTTNKKILFESIPRINHFIAAARQAMLNKVAVISSINTDFETFSGHHASFLISGAILPDSAGHYTEIPITERRYNLEKIEKDYEGFIRAFLEATKNGLDSRQMSAPPYVYFSHLPDQYRNLVRIDDPLKTLRLALLWVTRRSPKNDGSSEAKSVARRLLRLFRPKNIRDHNNG